MKRFYSHFICFQLILLSCGKVDCEKIANKRRMYECNIIVQDLPAPGRRFKVSGLNPSTQTIQTYLDQEAWYLDFNHKFTYGDTLVKKRGELKFYIHKKDTVLVFPFKCDGKLY